eukprot:364631-Chlamydomonas_euryale.AAC.2
MAGEHREGMFQRQENTHGGGVAAAGEHTWRGCSGGRRTHMEGLFRWLTTVAKLVGALTPLRMRAARMRSGTCCISGWTDTCGHARGHREIQVRCPGLLDRGVCIGSGDGGGSVLGEAGRTARGRELRARMGAGETGKGGAARQHKMAHQHQTRLPPGLA